ncbi:putative histidine kinase 2 [Canna indica]|uniref:histidine kinase n=1 Tax=Canna indica TaxID=4628 RepID=A0AAQ3KMG3_9LILI|nr:putative histidine kinase 2 [Canna indica]
MPSYIAKTNSWISPICTSETSTGFWRGNECHSVSPSSKTAGQVLPSKYKTEEDKKPLACMNILLVEDTPTSLLIVTKKITQLGANVTTSVNGSTALELIRNALRELDSMPEAGAGTGDAKYFPYDAILMDCEVKLKKQTSIQFDISL